MVIEHLADDLIYVRLPKTPHINCELKPVNDMINTGQYCDVILDFALVDIITSSSISALLTLHNLLHARNRQLILCDVAFLTKCIFTTTGLVHYFRFTQNQTSALKLLRNQPAC